MMETRLVNQLTPNPHSVRMYGEFSLANDSDFGLFNSIRQNGILEPIVINSRNVIISGVRRFMVAKMILELKNVPVRVIEGDEVTELNVIEYNLQRVKNEVQWAYELEVVRRELGSKQGVKLNKEGEKKLKEIKIAVGKNVSDSTRKRVVSAVKIQLELNPEKDEKDIWSELSMEVDRGAKVNSILKNLEAKRAKKVNDKKAIEYTDFENELFKIIQGDALNAHKQIDDDSVSNLTTSPPYWNFRFYDQNEGKSERTPLGNEPNVDLYIDALVEIFLSYKSKMKQNSSIFINVMDKIFKGKVCRIPDKLITKMESAGFEFIEPLMWYKYNPIYQGNQNNHQTSCEYILHFALNVDSFYKNKYWVQELESRELNYEALYGTDVPLIRNLIIPPRAVEANDGCHTPSLIATNVINKHALNVLLQKKGFQLTHSALYSYEIPMLCIIPFTKKNEVCLDVFSGLGTTGIVAYASDRSYIGVENSKVYAAQSKARFIELFLNKNTELIDNREMN